LRINTAALGDGPYTVRGWGAPSPVEPKPIAERVERFLSSPLGGTWCRVLSNRDYVVELIEKAVFVSEAVALVVKPPRRRTGDGGAGNGGYIAGRS
jgi:hypothetical protein